LAFAKYLYKVKDLSCYSGSKICFFDSGIGGLTLLYVCARKMPQAEFYYFADNFNVPYGSLSEEKMLQKTDKFFSEIEKLKPSAAVIGCNTVTAICAGYLRKKYDFPIIGIQPAVKPAAASLQSSAVLATPATAVSESLKRLVDVYGNGVTDIVACPDLAAYIEDNIFRLNAEDISKLLPSMEVKNIVLGCTHYIFAKEYISQKYNCKIFDGLEGTANRLLHILNAAPNDSGLHCIPEINFVGGDAEKNRRVFYEVLVTKK